MDLEENIDKRSLLSSYFSILRTFAVDSHTTPAQLDTILTWGRYIEVPAGELESIVKNPQASGVHSPDDSRSAIEQLYYLTYMIYLDEVVDDCEIEILMKYAEHLGFPQHIIGDLMKAILTAPSDGVPAWQVKNELKVLLEASSN